MKRLLTVFVIHLISLLALFIPNQFQGPVIAILSGFSLRVVDLIAILALISGTLFIFVTLGSQLASQMKVLKKINKDNNENKVKEKVKALEDKK